MRRLRTPLLTQARSTAPQNFIESGLPLPAAVTVVLQGPEQQRTGPTPVKTHANHGSSDLAFVSLRAYAVPARSMLSVFEFTER
jgi:hypothetical protein